MAIDEQRGETPSSPQPRQLLDLDSRRPARRRRLPGADHADLGAWARVAPKVVGVERSTPDSVTLALRANRAWEGFRAGQFIQPRCGDRRLVARALLLAGLGCRARPRARADGQARIRKDSSPTSCSSTPDRAWSSRLSQAEGDFRLPDRRPGRILLISGGSGITPVMSMLRTLCAEGHRGPITFLHYAPDPERAIYREELERLAADHPNLPSGPLLHPRPRRRGGRRALQPLPARGRRATLRARPRPSPAARPPCSTPSARRGRCGPRLEAPHGELRAAQLGAAGRRRGGHGPLRRPRTSRSRTAAPRCSSRPRRPDSAPSSAAGWASATPAPAARRRARSRTSPPARSPRATDEEIQICVSAPLGDVVVDL